MAAHFKDPQLFGTYITNFSCGPDSFIIGYFRDIMGRKPSLTLELVSSEATRSRYPFDFKLVFTFKLHGHILDLHQRFTNLSDQCFNFLFSDDDSDERDRGRLNSC